MKNLYLYPITARNKTGIINPYVGNLRDALKKHYNVVNVDKPSKSGIFDILMYIRKIDIIYLNWIEELPGLHWGVLQSIFFIIILYYIKCSRIKIVWTLHNKTSHFDKHQLIKSILYSQMLKKSDLIVTHAAEGLNHIPAKTPSAFIHHPMRSLDDTRTSDDGLPEYDIIIWGTISPYKGVDSFLEYLYKNGIIMNYKILIAGNVTTIALTRKLQQFMAEFENLKLINEFVAETELMSMIRKSKIVVFTYHSDSVLSSGALMDSLSQRATIIGPKAGAFNDLSKIGLIETFIDCQELVIKIDMLLKSSKDQDERKQNINKFIKENSWEDFSVTISHLMNKYVN
ncbi:MAG: glycosyltransferase [Bacteroidales bacterium]|nr:glycosyltransferase [Bacteroidales bacterium]